MEGKEAFRTNEEEFPKHIDGLPVAVVLAGLVRLCQRAECLQLHGLDKASFDVRADLFRPPRERQLSFQFLCLALLELWVYLARAAATAAFAVHPVSQRSFP